MLLICYSWTCIWPFSFGERRSMVLGGKLNLLIIFLCVSIYVGNLYIFTLNLVSPFRKVRLRANRLCIFCVMRTHYGHYYVLKQCQVNVSRHFITLFFLFRWNCCRRKQSIYKRRTLASNGLSFRNATRVLHKNVFKRAGYLRKYIFLKCLGRFLKMLNCLLKHFVNISAKKLEN